VQIPAAADGGGHDRDGRRDGGEGEREVQAAGERLLDEPGKNDRPVT